MPGRSSYYVTGVGNYDKDIEEGMKRGKTMRCRGQTMRSTVRRSILSRRENKDGGIKEEESSESM